MSTIKGLRSSLREKKRYIVYECLSERAFSARALAEEINRRILSFLGEYGCGQAGVMFVRQEGNKGVIRVGTRYVDHVKAAMTLVREIDTTPVVVKSIGVSGMLNRAIANFL